jgi:hypothetical protein
VASQILVQTIACNRMSVQDNRLVCVHNTSHAARQTTNQVNYLDLSCNHTPALGSLFLHACNTIVAAQ